jgi:hypothetical protein
MGTSNTRILSLAWWSVGLILGACGIAIVAVLGRFVPEPLLRGRMHGIVMLILEGCTVGACAILGQIARSRTHNSRPMWWLALATCIASAVSFAIALGPRAGAASSALALGAAVLVIIALVADQRARPA